MHQIRAIAISAAVLLAATTLAGCTLFGQQDPLPTVQVDTPEVPGSLSQPEDLAYGGGLLPATAKQPYALGGSLQHPGTSPAPTVWTSDDGLTWKAHEVDPGFDGAFTGSLAGSDKLTVLAGTAWTEGEIGTVLWTSKNRTSWKRIALPDEFAEHFRLAEFAVHDRDIILIGSDTDGDLGGIRVDGSDTKTLKLPVPPKGEKLTPVGIAWGDDDRVVLLAESAKEGATGPVVAYTSQNGGLKWSKKPADVVAPTDFASGVVWTGSAFVVTGGVYAGTSAGTPFRPAAWSSPDGVTWTAERVPASPSSQTGYATTDAWLGSPSAGTTGEVGAVQPNDNSALSGIFRRTTDGVWHFVTDTTVNEGNGVNGVALPLDDGRIVGAIGMSGSVRFGVVSKGWKDGTRVSTTARSAEVSSIQETPKGALLTLDRSVFTVGSDLHWNNSSVAGQVSVTTKGSVADAAWDPPEATSLIDIVGGTDGDEQVLIGSDYSSGEEIIAHGWYRPSPGEPWQAMTGFSGAGATEFLSVEHVGDLWIASGNYRTSSNVGTPAHGVVWTSADGVSWTQAAGEFGSGDLETSALDVCTTRKGDPITVGWRETSPGEFSIAAWSPVDGTWSAVDLGKFGDHPGYAYGCTVGDDGLILSAQLDGRTALLLDGKKGWEKVFEADTDDVLTNPVAVPGGYAASGSWSDATHSQPVVWLSADARTWTPVAVPSYDSGSTSQVSPLGDDLIVTMSPQAGPPVSIVRDIETVVGRYAKK